MDPFSQFPLNPNLGALEIGFLVSAFMFGLLTVQALIFHRKFWARDHWTLKLLVAVVWFFELGQLGCVAHAVYTITILKSGDLFAILKPPVTVGTSFLLGSAVGPLVADFSGFRGSYIQPLQAGSWRFCASAVGSFLAVKVIKMTSLSQFVDQFGWLFAMLLGMSAAIDLTISAWIAYFLARRRSRTRDTMHNESARQLLDRVILWTLQTGVITSLSFLVTLICYLLLGQYLIWLAVLAVLTKVSSNCFLASLNARASPRALGKNNTSLGDRSQPWSQNHESVNNGVSIVGNIIDMYQADDDEPFQTIHRSRASLGIDRSVFSPDGTVISATSTRSGYWAL
ncbi:hypothetical protein MSAN_01035500 [Mycena sanguinolenta]|uniref:DUF6534 domain-containing protein n=1 Tax=Mycena sanguinolenta TaxID=230812 RepID=A0A8H7D8V0_9AGAR|nr:hypothetical protein MSAN_01035500 [Mycena sanguinolenta]